jgi:glycosyltransferase involved in cell wall biosynthesis
MTYAIIIPAYNEAAFLPLTLQSLVEQSFPPQHIVVVNDQSTDNTAEVLAQWCAQHPHITAVETLSTGGHQPGAKVIRAFLHGFALVPEGIDCIVKADADLIFPPHYFEKMWEHFERNPKLGVCGGFALIEQQGQWVPEKLTDNDHVRGAFKMYRKACYDQIGGLQPLMGWDTADEMLARYFGWEVLADMTLGVKHLKPTGASYDAAALRKQGAAFYALGYGFMLTFLASLKLAQRKKRWALIIPYLQGYWQAQRQQAPRLVNPDQARFVRAYRYGKMKEKVKALWR